MKMRIGVVVFLASACAPTADELDVARAIALDPCGQGQMFGNAQHSGLLTCPGISGLQLRDALVIDPAAQQEHDDRGFYSVQVGAALTSGASVFLPVKRGYTDPFNTGRQTWGVQAWQWQGGTLVQRWSHDAKWKPVDALSHSITNFNEQLFAPVLTPTAVYAPGAAGTLERIDPVTGTLTATINPLAGTAFSGDQNTFVMSGLSADRAGNVWYTAVAFAAAAGNPVRGAWLVRVAPDNSSAIAAWSTLASSGVGIPQPTDLCQYSYGQAGRNGERPFPPTPNEPTFLFRCGGQRPGVNAAPAISADGRTVHVVSTDNNAITHLYLIAVDALTLRPLRASVFQGHLHDGCGVLIPYGPGFFDCRVGAPLGNDPNFNAPESITYFGPVANAPVIAPDGSTYFGGIGFDGYDDFRGHLYHFSPAGAFLGAFPFAFGTTPLLFPHGGTWSLIMDDNSTSDGTDPDGVFQVSRLAADFTRQSTFTQENLDVEANDTLDGQGVVDAAGNFYSLSAQGVVRRLDADGTVLEELALPFSAEQQSAVLSWGSDDQGRPVLYVPFLGTVFVIGTGGPSDHLVTSTAFPASHVANIKWEPLKLARSHVPDLALAAFSE